MDRAILINAEFFDLIVANPEIFGHDLDVHEDADDHNLSGALCEHSHGLYLHETKKRFVPNNYALAGDVHSHSHSDHHHRQSHLYDHGNAMSDPRTIRKHRGKYKPTDSDIDKLRSTLKQFVRDWSKEVNR